MCDNSDMIHEGITSPHMIMDKQFMGRWEPSGMSSLYGLALWQDMLKRRLYEWQTYTEQDIHI